MAASTPTGPPPDTTASLQWAMMKVNQLTHNQILYRGAVAGGLQPGVTQACASCFLNKVNAVHFFRHQSHRLCVHLLRIRQLQFTGMIYDVIVRYAVTHADRSALLRVCFSGKSRPSKRLPHRLPFYFPHLSTLCFQIHVCSTCLK